MKKHTNKTIMKFLPFVIILMILSSFLIIYVKIYPFSIFQTFSASDFANTYVITIKKTSVETDYICQIHLTTQNFIFSDSYNNGQDIRFYENPEIESTKLQYFLGEWSSNEAYIWVKIPQLLTNVRKEIIMVCGKADATSESNQNIMREFTSFEGIDQGGWSFSNSHYIYKWSEASYLGQIGCYIYDSAPTTTYNIKKQRLDWDYVVTTEKVEFYIRKETMAISGGNIGVLISRQEAGGFKNKLAIMFACSSLTGGYLVIKDSVADYYTTTTIYDNHWYKISLWLEFGVGTANMGIYHYSIYDMSAKTLVKSGYRTMTNFIAYVGTPDFTGIKIFTDTNCVQKVSVDFTSCTYSNYPEPTVNVSPPAPYQLDIKNPSDMKFPSNSLDEEITVCFSKGDIGLSGYSIKMLIHEKGGFLEYTPPSVITDSSGLATITFNSPPYYDTDGLTILSPFPATFYVDSASYIKPTQINVYPQIGISISSDPSQTYDTAGEKDLYVKARIFDKETSTDITGLEHASISITITTDGYTITPIISIAGSEIIIEAKVWQTIGSTTSRDLNITVIVSLTNYYPGTESVIVTMSAPSINIQIGLSSTVSINIKSFKIFFKDNDGIIYNFPSEVTLDVSHYIVIVITYEDTPYTGEIPIQFLPDKSLLVEYTFVKAGNYEITIIIQNMESWGIEDGTSKSITTRAQESTNPFIDIILNPINLIIIIGVIVVLYVVFRKPKPKREDW